MIHHWSEKTLVRPRTGIEIGNNALYVSNYLSLTPVKDVQMYPVAYCNGTNSKTSFNSVIFAKKHGHIDVGSKVVLNGKNSNADIVSRNISTQGSEVYARAKLIANTPQCRGHLECLGLLLGKDSKMFAIPELEVNMEGAELSHEAAVGKIADEQIQYLMTRGLSESDAIAAIIRGFMDISILGLPVEINNDVSKIMYEMDFGA
jgi:Fe-S cluster assembly protein SufB